MTAYRIDEVMKRSGVKFGTSGARGLAASLSDEVAYIYTTAFLQYLSDIDAVDKRGAVSIGGDLRPSTERIMRAIATAVEDFGAKAIPAGRVPSPALALFGFTRGIPTIMVTGSHIPADRNGIKFTLPTGEMMKSDELGMREQKVVLESSRFNTAGELVVAAAQRPLEEVISRDYINRYLGVFPKNLLSGKKIGVYQHSAVGRDLIVEIVKSLGAEVEQLGRSEQFVPVDTEAIRPEDRNLASQWSKEHRLASILSTDGDSDRPLISDENGRWLRGDVAGVLVAKFLNASSVATPVSCNSLVESCGEFKKVARTKIGSPYVIEAMQELNTTGSVTVGYEANGGFLLGSECKVYGNNISALPTRDAVIVFLSILAASKESSQNISELLAELPSRFTASDRLENFPTEKSLSIIEPMSAEAVAGDYQKIEQYLEFQQSLISRVDVTDGLRIILKNDEIIHVRPSGNAPELRCYSEAESEERAEQLLQESLAKMKRW